MVRSDYNKYVVKLIGRFNPRYYFVEIHNKFYIIDYANPKDVRTYFSGLFPSYNTSYTIYAVANIEENKILSLPWWLSYTGVILEYILALIIALSTILPRSFNPINLLYDVRIVRHWQLVLVLFSFGFLSIALCFMIKSQNILAHFAVIKTYRLTRVEQAKGVGKLRFSQKFFDFLVSFFGVPICLFVGIMSSNYLLLLCFSFIGGYELLFSRFINAYVTFKRYKYQINQLTKSKRS